MSECRSTSLIMAVVLLSSTKHPFSLLLSLRSLDRSHAPSLLVFRFDSIGLGCMLMLMLMLMLIYNHPLSCQQLFVLCLFLSRWCYSIEKSLACKYCTNALYTITMSECERETTTTTTVQKQNEEKKELIHLERERESEMGKEKKESTRLLLWLGC